MMKYPVYIKPEGETVSIYTINDQAEFMENFEGIFTEEIIEELARATVLGNLGTLRDNSNDISLQVEKCKISFSSDGKIWEIATFLQ